MGRIRSIKPEFFRHLKLFQVEIETGLPLRVAYAGLWTVADREGRFRWQPEVLKLDVLPFDNLDFSRVLDVIEGLDMIRSYVVDGKKYGHIPTFLKHQVINMREQKSVFPAPEETQKVPCAVHAHVAHTPCTVHAHVTHTPCTMHDKTMSGDEHNTAQPSEQFERTVHTHDTHMLCTVHDKTMPSLDINTIESFEKIGCTVHAHGTHMPCTVHAHDLYCGEKEREREQEKEKEKKTSCSEPKKTGSELNVKPSVISIPLVGKINDSQEFDILQSMIDDWAASYPAVNVIQELHNIRQWNIANPTRRKTKAGILRHINSWLADKQNKGGSIRGSENARGAGFKTIVSTGDRKMDISLTNAMNWAKKQMEGTERETG